MRKKRLIIAATIVAVITLAVAVPVFATATDDVAATTGTFTTLQTRDRAQDPTCDGTCYGTCERAGDGTCDDTGVCVGDGSGTCDGSGACDGTGDGDPNGNGNGSGACGGGGRGVGAQGCR